MFRESYGIKDKARKTKNQCCRFLKKPRPEAGQNVGIEAEAEAGLSSKKFQIFGKFWTRFKFSFKKVTVCFRIFKMKKFVIMCHKTRFLRIKSM